MAKILLFGSSSVVAVPGDVVSWLQSYTSQGHEFIVGDRKGADATFHKTLSSVGALDNSTIYCMDAPKNNLYEIKCKSFITGYNEETKEVEIVASDGSMEPYIISGVEKEMDIPVTRQWYEFRDRQMINECDMAICVSDGESKTALHMIQLLNILNKPCYCFNI